MFLAVSQIVLDGEFELGTQLGNRLAMEADDATDAARMLATLAQPEGEHPLKTGPSPTPFRQI